MFVNTEGLVTYTATEDTPIRIDKINPFQVLSVDEENSIEVYILPKTAEIPRKRIEYMISGPVEQFRSKTKLTDAGKTPVVGLWLEFRDGAPKRHEFIVGGDPLNITIPLKNMGGCENLAIGNPDSVILAKQKTSDLRFRPGSNVTEWMGIEERFASSLSTPGFVVDWAASAILTRFKIEASPESNKDCKVTIKLEAIIFSPDLPYSSVPPEAKEVLVGGAPMTFLLWSIAMKWH